MGVVVVNKSGKGGGVNFQGRIVTYVDQPLQDCLKVCDWKKVQRLIHLWQRYSFEMEPGDDGRKTGTGAAGCPEQVSMEGGGDVLKVLPRGSHDVEGHEILARPTPALFLCALVSHFFFLF